MSASCQPQQPLNFWSLKFINVKLKQSFLQKVKTTTTCLFISSLIFISYLLPSSYSSFSFNHLHFFLPFFAYVSLRAYLSPRRRQPSVALHRLALVSSTRSLGSGINRKTRELDYRSSSRLKIDCL